MSFLKISAAALLASGLMASAAMANDAVHLTGSSTVLPFATIVAESFGESTSFKTPIVEGGGTGAGIKKFCEGVGDGQVDIANASRKMKSGEVKDCKKNGVDGILEPAQIDQVVEYVLNISGQDHDAALAAQGATVFAENCAVCHTPEGTGNRDLGAPNLTDAIWLYGGDRATLVETVTKARYGVMPAWGGKLSEADIRAVATYVHSLGGGEAAVP